MRYTGSVPSTTHSFRLSKLYVVLQHHLPWSQEETWPFLPIRHKPTPRPPPKKSRKQQIAHRSCYSLRGCCSIESNSVQFKTSIEGHHETRAFAFTLATWPQADASTLLPSVLLDSSWTPVLRDSRVKGACGLLDAAAEGPDAHHFGNGEPTQLWLRVQPWGEPATKGVHRAGEQPRRSGCRDREGMQRDGPKGHSRQADE